MKRLSLGLRYMLAAALGFSVMTVLAKLCTARLASQQVVLTRAVITLALSYATLRSLGLSPRGRRPGLLLLRSAFGTAALLCFYYSLAHLPLAEATIIQHTSAVFTALLAALVLREAVSGRVVVATIASLAGVALIVRPSGLVDAAPLAVAVALAGAVLAAAAYVVVRRLRDHDDPHVVVFYFPLFAVPLTLPLALPVWQWPTAREWLLLAGVGVSSQLAQVCMTRGLALETAGRATSMNYMQLVFSVALGVVLFGEWPHATTLVGAAIVVASTLGLALSTRRAAAAVDG